MWDLFGRRESARQSLKAGVSRQKRWESATLWNWMVKKTLARELFFCLWGVRISAFSIQSKWRRKGVREMSTSIEASRCVCHCLEYTIGLNAVCTCWYTHVFLSDILVLIFCYYVALLTLSVSLSYHYTCNPSVTTGLTTHTNQWHRFSYGNAWI